MPTLPTNRTSANTVAEHVDDHNALHAFYNAQSGSSVLVDFGFSIKSAGDLSASSTSWANLDTGLDLTLTASAGHVIEASVSGLWDTQNVVGQMDVVTVVGGSPINAFSSGSGTPDTNGVAAWFGPANSNHGPIQGSTMYTLQAGDISSGTVTLRLRVKVASAVTRGIFGTNPRFVFTAKNFGAIPA